MPGLTHVVLGSSDVARSRLFYDKVMAAVGLAPMIEKDDMVLYGADAPALMVRTPLNGEPATFGNGSTIGFAAESRAAVDAFHAAGLANGGSCEGAPGPRAFSPTAYGAYLRDPDGNKMCAFSHAPELTGAAG